MSDRSRIEWTDATWNPVRGCTKVSSGCKHCYAQTFAERFRGVKGHPFEQGFDLRLVPSAIELPTKWRRPRNVFVNSMSDLFHEHVPFAFIDRVFQVMSRCPQHQFQVLTKRSKRLAQMAARLPWPGNIWIGVSVEDNRYIGRLEHLIQVPAAVRFLSIEPLIGPVDDLDVEGIDWVIVGGESGPWARPMKPEWVRTIRDRCLSAKVPFFFKQWGGKNKKAAGRTLDGQEWNEMPRLGARSKGRRRRLSARAR